MWREKERQDKETRSGKYAGYLTEGFLLNEKRLPFLNTNQYTYRI